MRRPPTYFPNLSWTLLFSVHIIKRGYDRGGSFNATWSLTRLVSWEKIESSDWNYEFLWLLVNFRQILIDTKPIETDSLQCLRTFTLDYFIGITEHRFVFSLILNTFPFLSSKRSEFPKFWLLKLNKVLTVPFSINFGEAEISGY